MTDADLVLGLMDPGSVLPRPARAVDRPRACGDRAARRPPRPRTVEQAAAGIVRVADAKMADLVRRVCMLRGLDPREFTCLRLRRRRPRARRGGLPRGRHRRVVVPLMTSRPVWSALGAVSADVVHVYQSRGPPAAARAARAADRDLRAPRGPRADDAGRRGLPPEDVRMQRTVRVSAAAQVHAVEVPVKDGPLVDADLETIDRDFDAHLRASLGKGSGSRAGGVRHHRLPGPRDGRTAKPDLARTSAMAQRPCGQRPIYWPGLRSTRTHRSSMRPLRDRHGPALIELPDTVIAIRPGSRARR